MAKRRERKAHTKRAATPDAKDELETARPAAARGGSAIEATALFILLAVVAVRPLILESYSSAQVGPALDLRQPYFLTGEFSPKPRPLAFLRALSPLPESAASFDVAVPAGATVEGHALTPPGVPGRASWETGPWTVRVHTARPNPSIDLSVGARRVGKEGASRGQERLAPKQTLGEAGVQVFTFPAMGWPAGDAADRVGIVYRFHNTSDTDAAVTLETGGADADVTTPGVYIPALPGPMPTVGFDAAILTTLLLYAVAVARSGRWSWRRTGIELGAAILLVALIVSTVVAGNKRMAIIGAVDFACLLLLAMLLTQLLRRPWQVRLALCVIVATATVAAARCVEQVFEFDETIAQYSASEGEAWAAGGRDTEDPVARLFRSRLLARDPTAYMAHPNIAGSYLLLAAFAAAALAAAKFGATPQTFRRLFACITAAVALLLVAAVALTSSLGAAVAGAAAAVVFVALALGRRRLARQRGRVLAAGWLAVLLGAVVVLGFGRTTGSLPSASLAFRWQYWSTSWPMIRDHLLGVGSGQFGRNYLQYKPVTSPDEVANAHNMLVHAAAEWGVIGLVGLVTLLGGMSVVLAMPGVRVASIRGDRTGPVPSGGHVLTYAVGLTAVVVAVFVATSFGTSGAHLVLVCAVPALVFPMTFVLGAIDSDRLDRFDDEPLPVVLWFLCAGLLAFCVHNVISFSLFVPAAATPFFALAAIAVSVRHADGDPPSRPASMPTRVALPVVGAAALAAFMLLVFRPVATGGAKLLAARTATHYATLPANPGDHPASSLFAAAAAADPLDPVPPSDRARWLAEYPYTDPPTAIANVEHAARLVRAAIARDPHNGRHYRQLAAALTTAFGWAKEPQFLRDAVAAAEQVVLRYPESPQDHLTLARVYDHLFEATDDRTAAENALRAYRRALALDAARPDYEVRRFSPPVRDAAEQRVKALETYGAVAI